MTSLVIENASKAYDGVPAIENVSLELSDGEFLVLVGPSGCGKSTLLRMIAGLESLDGGRIALGERDVSHVDPKDRDIAMVFQNYALYPHMTVYENMAFALQQRKIAKGEIRERVMEAARVLNLQEFVERKPAALSGGQRQRVAMGRAIVRNPAIYLMDEPLSNLDAKLRVQMRAELKLLRRRLGVTTVYVTHDQIEAMTLGDRVAVLRPIGGDGESNLQQVDSPQALYLAPANLFVAGFIGSPSMNFFHAEVEAGAVGVTLRIAGTDTAFDLSAERHPVAGPLSRYVGGRVVLGVRPEFLTLDAGAEMPGAPPPGRAARATLDVDVLVTERVGPDAYLHFDIETPEVDIEEVRIEEERDMLTTDASRFTARVSTDGLSADPSRVRLKIDVDRIHLFDPHTTLAITP